MIEMKIYMGERKKKIQRGKDKFIRSMNVSKILFLLYVGSWCGIELLKHRGFLNFILKAPKIVPKYALGS